MRMTELMADFKQERKSDIANFKQTIDCRLANMEKDISENVQ